MYQCSLRVGEAGTFSLRVHIGNPNPSLSAPHHHLAMDDTSDAHILGDESPFLLRLSEELTIHQPVLSCSTLSISYPAQLRPFYTSHLVIKGVDQFGNLFTDYGDENVHLVVKGVYEENPDEESEVRRGFGRDRGIVSGESSDHGNVSEESSDHEIANEESSDHEHVNHKYTPNPLVTQTHNSLIQNVTVLSNLFNPIQSLDALYYNLLPLTDASCLSLSISCFQDGEEKTFTRKVPVTLATNMLLSNLDVNITVQPKESLLSATVSLVNQQHVTIPMDDYRAIFVVHQLTNQSIRNLTMNHGESLTLTTELPFSGETLITLFVQDPEGRTLQVAERSVQLPDPAPTSARVFGEGLFAPSLLDPASSCYGGVFFLQYYSSERDPVSCDAREDSFTLNLFDKISNKAVAVFYSVETSGTRCIFSYNFTGTLSSYVLSLSRDSIALYQKEVLLTDPTLTHSVSVQNLHPFMAMDNETMAASLLSNGILLQFTSSILDLSADSISLLCDDGYTESSFLIRKESVNTFRIVPMIPSSGIYSFRIFLFNYLLEQTLRLEIQPNTAEQTSWLFWGSGVAGGLAGESLIVNARKQDLYANVIPLSNPRLHVQSSEQVFSVTGESVGNHVQFQYSILSLPSNTTWTTVTLTIETSVENVTVTPLFRGIFVTAGAVDWNHSIVWGAAEVFAGDLYSFHLNLRDVFSNYLPSGFGSYGLAITGEN